MDRQDVLRAFWNDVTQQNDFALRGYFTQGAYVRWNNTNEQFTVSEFVIVNCEYPGDWRGEIERIETIGDLSITVTRVWLSDDGVSFHVTSFFEFEGDQIKVLNEYWGDDGVAPTWRLEKHIGRPIITAKETQ